MNATIVVEYNCPQSVDAQVMASLWVITGSLPSSADLGDLDSAVKIIGPINTIECERASVALAEALKKMGLKVETETVADD